MPSIYDSIPNSPFYYPQTNTVSTQQGPVIAGNGITINQFGVMTVASALGGTVTAVTAGTGLSGGTITLTGTLGLLPATIASIGGIKVGANLLIAPDGTLSALPPGTGTISGVTAGNGLQGGGITGNVLLSLVPASATQFGGVTIGPGIDVSTGTISLATATPSQRGGVQLATAAEVIAGADANKAVTPATLATKIASTTVRGIVQLSDSVVIDDSTKAATQTAVKIAYDAAIAAQLTANDALPKSGGTLTGPVIFAGGQTFPGVAFPVATSNSLGVVSAGPGLSVNSSGVLSTTNNGTVTAVTAGPGLGSPASGNTITTSGVLKLLPPTIDGLQLGGVKAGSNVSIAFDGTISVPGTNFLATNNQYSYNGYIWPIPNAAPALPCPGSNGQILTILDSATGTIGWTQAGTLSSIIAGAGISVVSGVNTATISLAAVPSVTPGNYGGTTLIPTLSINEYGQLISTGQANCYPPFQIPSVTFPFALVLDFTTNDTNWEWTLQGGTTIQNPVNAVSGQTGMLVITQNPLTPYSLTWGSSWKFPNFTPFIGTPTAGAVDAIQFTVVSPNYIVVTAVLPNLG